MATMNIVQAKLILRNGLAADWTLKNPVLAKGELGAEIDTGLLKLGDGTSAFTDLPYINVSQVFINEKLEEKVNKSGDIINGALTLNYTPMAATDAVNKAYVDEAINSAGLLKRAIVPELPALQNTDPNTIYMVKDNKSLGPDTYKEYLIIEGALTQIGDTSVDLTNYVQKPETFTSGNIAAFAADGSLVDSGISSITPTIGIASDSIIGGVLSSTDDNSIAVDSATGKMNINRVSVNNLYVPEEDEFILFGGGA